MRKASKPEIWLMGAAFACDTCGKVFMALDPAIDCHGTGALNLSHVDTPAAFRLAMRAAGDERATAEARRRADRMYGKPTPAKDALDAEARRRADRMYGDRSK